MITTEYVIIAKCSAEVNRRVHGSGAAPATEQGYVPDCVVCAAEVSLGRGPRRR